MAKSRSKISPVAVPHEEAKPFRVLQEDGPPERVRIDFTSGSGKQNSTAAQMFIHAMVDAVGHTAAAQYQGVYPVVVLAQAQPGIEAYMIESYQLDRKNCTWLNEAMEVVDRYTNVLRAHAEERLRRERVEFDDVPLVFKRGAQVTFDVAGELCGGVIRHVKRRRNWIGAVYFEVQTEVVHNMGGGASRGVCTTTVHNFDGMHRLDQLPIRFLDDETRKKLTARGDIYAKHSTGASIASYDGQLVRSSWWGDKNYRADGRVILDVNSFKRVDHDQFQQEQREARFATHDNEYESDSEKTVDAKLDPADHWRTYPFLYGFSLHAKQWGRIAVSGLAEVNWRSDAFDKLVLETETKHLVRSLVANSSETFDDLIEGKGGGCIFLLHGPPGEGKTLTAEAVAELLHRPLYAISVGELGVTPDQLEERLRMILDVATVWNAVVLLDEADIYLEARDERDVVRNAMVGVFLRLLEYHQGVLFLTTNRVKNIDKAFYSRVSLAIHYVQGDVKKRVQIWRNLLEAAKLDNGIDPHKLATQKINGRQIKTSIRLAQTLAREAKKDVSTESLLEVINYVTKFEDEQRERLMEEAKK